MSIVCIGFCSVDVLIKNIKESGEGHTSFADQISTSVGGDAANQALTLAALGHDVRLVTQVGDDVWGQMVRECCLKGGLDCGGIVTGDEPTAVSVIMIREDGQRSIIAGRGRAAECLRPWSQALAAINQRVKIVSIGSLFGSRYMDDEVLLKIFKKAKAAGAVTVADFVTDMKDRSLDSYKDSFKYLDYAMPSIEEAAYFTGSGDPREIARIFKDLGIGNTIVKLGTDGVFAHIEGREFFYPAFHVEAKDTTGAGDSFVAGFISALYRGLPPEEAVRFASAVAALSVTGMGASGAVHDAEQVMDFIRANS